MSHLAIQIKINIMQIYKIKVLTWKLRSQCGQLIVLQCLQLQEREREREREKEELSRGFQFNLFFHNNELI